MIVMSVYNVQNTLWKEKQSESFVIPFVGTTLETSLQSQGSGKKHPS